MIHIPKTAGSTVNHYLKESGMPGADHIEAWLHEPEKATNLIRESAWLSGHVSLTRMASFLQSATSREPRFYTVLRKPGNQVRSHYNWLIEIFHRGPGFYDPHPEHIKEISERIRSSDNSRPRAIIDNLARTPGLFLNQQSRVALGEDALSLHGTALSERLRRYEHVATESSIAELIGAMTGKIPEATSYQNKSGYHFDPSVFDSPEMHEFLSAENAKDDELYQLVADNSDFSGRLNTETI